MWSNLNDAFRSAMIAGIAVATFFIMKYAIGIYYELVKINSKINLLFSTYGRKNINFQEKED